MADPVNYGNHEREIEQALIGLKKGTQLLKYNRKGKPKFRAFRLSPDETALLWYSHGNEKSLKLSSVSRIIPGQRTAVFRRHLRPEKDYLSFSLVYNKGERSLDLICKDKAEVEAWLACLKSLIGQNPNRRARSEIPDLHDFDSISNGSPFGGSLDYTNSIVSRGSRTSVDLGSHNLFNFASSDVRSECANMQLRTSTDGFRISVSSTPSCSSAGSGQDDIESLGDVYVWGEVWTDGVLPDGSLSAVPIKSDVLTPKPLESNVVLDVHQISCGVRHLALVTRQGEVFTWGEESGGRLGHGVEKDVSHPCLVEFLAVTNMEFVACGEFHTCAVSTSGDLFTWGDGIHSAGLLGHGTDVSHCIPKRVSGSLEGLQVLSVACGTWHSALATANGKLFTFGDGSFGVLGHGDRESVSCPKEIQALNGHKTVKVACGVWHTAAIVEAMSQPGSAIPSRKLFTWGDGEKYRLGHGNKDTCLVPTCVSQLKEYNFHQLACGHTMTIALTTSGHVFTMGGTAYGQLGNPSSEGRLPCLVQDRLVGEFVEEISCGAYHAVVLTSRSEVFTWGRGANGRLGHGDTEDRKTPTLVEALKDRHVKNISCGSNFTSSICIHKWVSGADQSVCSGCRQAFGFTRKRHNCYNCGLVHCHGCSSKKALKAALAPTPGKPHRVCDACYVKLKAGEVTVSSTMNRKSTVARQSLDGRERFTVARQSKILLSPTSESVKHLEIRSWKPGAGNDFSIGRSSLISPLSNLKEIAFPSSLTAIQSAFKPPVAPASAPGSGPPSRTPSPPPPAKLAARRPSPPRSAGFSRSLIDSLKKTNEVLNQEVAKLQSQIKSLKQKYNAQELKLQTLQENAIQTSSLATNQSVQNRAAIELVKLVTEQLKQMTDKLPPEISESESFKSMSAQAESFLNTYDTLDHEAPTDLLNQRLEGHLDSSGVSHDLQDHIKSSASESAQNDGRPPEGSRVRTGGGNEIIEQFEPGVYVTYVPHQNGGKVFRRVRFSKRRFAEQQAEEWWSKNKDRLLKLYSPQSHSTATISSPTNPPPPDENDEAVTPSET